ncbi:uncharacterized protein CLUP02_05321 [Colletotrichum lupini]|uniref:Uncharacterized protein n=1 Tax=Colletotrichum lupini TaxID=145971 RepID=A0A9Q8SN35_9PEZI|nr:uncharacterized protein CLUP02_05321 [Colletotrichum lupini]UQC79841.1 hypothetical protein CLUP02_05321 [Colletotrichum lupini]
MRVQLSPVVPAVFRGRPPVMPSPVVAPASVRASHGGALAPSWLRIHVVVLTHPLNVPRIPIQERSYRLEYGNVSVALGARLNSVCSLRPHDWPNNTLSQLTSGKSPLSPLPSLGPQIPARGDSSALLLSLFRLLVHPLSLASPGRFGTCSSPPPRIRFWGETEIASILSFPLLVSLPLDLFSFSPPSLLGFPLPSSYLLLLTLLSTKHRPASLNKPQATSGCLSIPSNPLLFLPTLFSSFDLSHLAAAPSLLSARPQCLKRTPASRYLRKAPTTTSFPKYSTSDSISASSFAHLRPASKLSPVFERLTNPDLIPAIDLLFDLYDSNHRPLLRLARPFILSVVDFPNAYETCKTAASHCMGT